MKVVGGRKKELISAQRVPPKYNLTAHHVAGRIQPVASLPLTGNFAPCVHVLLHTNPKKLSKAVPGRLQDLRSPEPLKAPFTGSTPGSTRTSNFVDIEI
jgi:hypothetical protein